MIDPIGTGEIAVAYIVLGSYGLACEDLTGKIEVIDPADYTTMMLRTATILKNRPNPDGAGFLDFLIARLGTRRRPPIVRFGAIRWMRRKGM